MGKLLLYFLEVYTYNITWIYLLNLGGKILSFIYFTVILSTIVALFVYQNSTLKRKNKILESLLKEKEEKLKFIYPIENIDFITIIRTDITGRIHYLSKVLSEKLGFRADELIGKTLQELSISEDLTIETQNWEKLINGEMKNFAMDKRLLSKFGGWNWFHCNYILLNGGEKEDTEIIVYCIDINWRKQIEQSLSQSYELNEMLLNSIDTKIAAFDVNGNFIAVNKSMQKFCLDTEIIHPMKRGVSIIDMHSNLTGDTFSNDTNRLNRIKEVISSNGDSYTFEYCYERGLQKHWYLTNISSLENQFGAIVSYTDITKQKILEEKLVKSEDRYRTLMEFLPIAVILHNKSGIVYCNQAGLKLLGFNSMDESLGKSLINFIHIDYKMNFIEKFMGTHNSALHAVKELLINSKDENIPVEVDHTRIIYDDELMSLFIIKDIRERIKADNFERAVEEKSKQLEEAIEYDKIKTEFFANISHELRTPINIIFSSLQVMGLKAKDSPAFYEDISKYMGMIKQNCYRLLRLVNNLIDITRIDSGFFNISIKNYDIINIVENITMSVANFVENRNIELIFDTEIEEKKLACDPDKIERIMLNLLANSVKFTPEGGQITVNIYDKINEIDIVVKDTGLGIPQDKLDIIFERFRQVDKTLSRNREGSGIGLSLVRSLVELHNGSISVKSEYGKGSEFILTLPVRTVEEDHNSLSHSNLWQENVEKISVEFSDIYS